jgi:hypothetical protein
LAAFAQEGWAFVQKQVLQENLVRFTAGSGKRIPSSVFFVTPFLVEGFPWSLLFGVGLWNFARHAPVREKGVLPLIWWFAVFIFFSISAGKRNVYLLPAYPAMALFAAEWGWPWLAAQERPAPGWLKMLLRVLAVVVAGLLLLGVIATLSGRLTVHTPWVDHWLGDDKWNNLAIHIRFLQEFPLYASSVYGAACVIGVWAVFVGANGRWRSALWGVLGLLLVTSIGMYPFTRAYYKEFKAFTGFAAAIQKQVGAQDAFWFYTPVDYSSEFDEFSQVYFYLNRQVQLAPCAEQPNFAQCPPGYYLLRERHWKELSHTPRAQLLLDSNDFAGPDPETRLVVVRLDEQK